MRRRIVGLGLVLTVAAVLPAGASEASGPSPFGLTCSAQSDGVRFCSGDGASQRVPSWDGTPLDVDVTLPPTGTGPFPTIAMLHGYGNDKTSFESTNPTGDGSVTYHYNNDYYAQQGFAVLNYSARGWAKSCGGGAPQAQAQTGACANGFIRLADQRYEARDTQFLLGELVDQGVAQANALGVTGISYGGGQSIELAYLRNRIRCAGETASHDPCSEHRNGAFIPWKSPRGTSLAIAAAFPRWPWSDLVSSLLPNGRFQDFNPRTNRASRSPFGVPIQSYVAGLYALGNVSGYYEQPQAPNSANSPWDITTDYGVVNAGEPYGAQAMAIANEIYSFHQGFGIPRSKPAPMLLESGWNDDLFPVTQSLRIYNDIRTRHHGSYVALLFGDVGHSRGSNKPTVNHAFNDTAAAFFALHLRGGGAEPAPGSVTAFTTTCPSSGPSAPPDGGPYTATSWSAVHPGAVRFSSTTAQVVIAPGGNPQTASSFDPIANSDGCKTIPTETAPGTAVYSLLSQGFTLMGLPTIAADIATTGINGQLDARLWDVSPSGTQLLVTRGNYRLTDDQTGLVKFQLHGNGYYFAPGHTIKLELLGSDSPYYRASNGSFSVSVQRLVAVLPTLESPGSAAQVQAPPNLRRLRPPTTP
jgi:fermentation-respiration switch protein FrsA (DUF1100 family)